MFTGLIQGLGSLALQASDRLQILCAPQTRANILEGLAIGDSVAVDGVCLTVVECLPQGFIADASPETRARSTLGQQQGAWVNLEPSLRVGSKLGGHFVTGHVDGIGYLSAAIETATFWEMTFTVFDARVTRYIVPKGSIAVNGISLTIADCDPEGTCFTVAVIPLTYDETNLKYLQPGSPVNLEGDILGKYVEKFLRLGPASYDREGDLAAAGIDSSFLAEHGYF
ncbi:MAG: riboflavin synthase [Leptolyngbyaceae cyanobacterium]